MNIAAIKRLNENMPYWIKKPFARMIRNRLIENKVFLKQYELLERADGMTEREINKLQMDELKKVLVHAYRHTEYYRELMDSRGFDPEAVSSPDDLKRLPVLTKELLKENYEKLQADDVDNFYDVRTGGTTGEPTHVLMEKDAIYREWAFTYHYWSKFGYDRRKSKLATLRGVDLHGKLYEINPLYQEIRLNVFRLNRDNIKEYIKRIDSFAAEFVYGYPSAVYNLCRLAREAGIKLERRFKAALLISENLYDFQENEIKAVLKCPIAMFYGHSERAVYAEKYDRGYVFQPLYGIIEISDEGHPVVTGFINGKTPLIRYEVDDYVEPIEDEEVSITGHRNSEVVYGVNGEQFRASALNFHGAISSVFPWFQFVQDIPGKLILRVPTGYSSQEELDQLCAEIDSRSGGAIEVAIEIVTESPELHRGGVQVQTTCTKNIRCLTKDTAPIDESVKDDIASQYKVVGHWYNDILYGANGEQISAAAINFHDKTFEGIEKYQFVQYEAGSCVLNVVPAASDVTDSKIIEIEKSLHQKFGSALSCKVCIVEELEMTSSGKYRMVVRKSGGGG